VFRSWVFRPFKFFCERLSGTSNAQWQTFEWSLEWLNGTSNVQVGSRTIVWDVKRTICIANDRMRCQTFDIGPHTFDKCLASFYFSNHGHLSPLNDHEKNIKPSLCLDHPFWSSSLPHNHRMRKREGLERERRRPWVIPIQEVKSQLLACWFKIVDFYSFC